MILAHAGHWATAIGLGGPPVAGVLWALYSTLRDKRRAKKEHGG